MLLVLPSIQSPWLHYTKSSELLYFQKQYSEDGKEYIPKENIDDSTEFVLIIHNKNHLHKGIFHLNKSYFLHPLRKLQHVLLRKQSFQSLGIFSYIWIASD